jgi:O-acetylserine/cysteine efflux transporter
LTPLHTAAALLIAATWGFNFTAIRFGLDEMAPLTFAFWRFVLAALPVFFVARPAISWPALAGIGGFMFAGQFVFLFLAMQTGLPPGLTSVLVQLQGPLTAVLAALVRAERALLGQWLGLAVAVVGVIVIGRSVEGTANALAVGLALMSALTWAVGNLFFRAARGASLFAITAWASLMPVPPLAVAAFAIEGWQLALAPVLAPTWKMWLTLLYTVVPVMWLGYIIWGTLLRTYPAAKAGPVSLLVPCFALVFASFAVDEPVGGLRLLGVVIVLGGVAVATFAAGRQRSA